MLIITKDTWCESAIIVNKDKWFFSPCIGNMLVYTWGRWICQSIINNIQQLTSLQPILILDQFFF